MRIVRALPVLALLACGHPLVDDYRESWAIIEGDVLASSGAPVGNALVHATPLAPLYASGDSVLTDASGRFEARIGSFGVMSFRADVQLEVIVDGGVKMDTVFRNILVAERGRARPDTLHVHLSLP